MNTLDSIWVFTSMLEEYQQAVMHFKFILSKLSLQEFTISRNPQPGKAHWESIQSVTIHVVKAGHTYANYWNTATNKEWIEYESPINKPIEGIYALDAMLEYTHQAYERIMNRSEEEVKQMRFETRWGATYDFEQLTEHAIVHVLVHRRQIEKYWLTVRDSQTTKK